MSAGYQALTEKEKQTLRLIVRGHDAKSMARHLGLSVHTVNERLRDARRKLEVTSSREAARRLLDTEDGPQDLADRRFGEAALPRKMGGVAALGTDQRRLRPRAGVIAGGVIMTIVVGILAVSLLSGGANPSITSRASSASAATAVTATSESAAVQSARDWLVLGDQGRWKDGWLATGTAFRRLNSADQWAEAAEKARVPLGAVVSRTLLSQDHVPAPPAGVEVVKFRTSFANKAEVIETVSLAREDSHWKVVGIFLD